VFLALDRYPIDSESDRANETANFVFYLIFCLEMMLKLYGLGVRQYMRDGYNVFDAIVVLLSTVEIILANSDVNSGNSGQAISAFRCVRLLRIFKLAKSWTGLR
jgi:hypothetical protein